MQMNHRLMTYAYHFLSEALLLFLFVLPIIYFYLSDVVIPYWLYAGVALIMCVVFTYMTKKSQLYGIYMMMAPVWLLLFYWIGFPFVISLLFAALLTWRAIMIREDTGLNRESTYLKLTITVTLILVLIVQEIEVVAYGLLLCLVLMVGYLMSHLLVINRRERKHFNHGLWMLVLGSFVIGAIIVVFAFDLIRFLLSWLWNIIQWALLVVINVIASTILPFFDFELEIPERELKLDGEVGGEFADLLEGVTPSELSMAPYLYGFLMLIGIGAIVFIFYRYFKRSFQQETDNDEPLNVEYVDLDEGESEANERSLFDRLKDRVMMRHTHPARALVYQFEKKHPRFTHETVEEWLHRLQMAQTIPIYQKVRYGEQEITKDELNQLKRDLQLMDKILKGELS